MPEVWLCEWKKEGDKFRLQSWVMRAINQLSWLLLKTVKYLKYQSELQGALMVIGLQGARSYCALNPACVWITPLVVEPSFTWETVILFRIASTIPADEQSANIIYDMVSNTHSDSVWKTPLKSTPWAKHMGYSNQWEANAYISCLQESHFRLKGTQAKSKGMEKSISCK